ncbi:MAG: hypothetical protein U0325_23020 [Polyangiales bacterium]
MNTRTSDTSTTLRRPAPCAVVTATPARSAATRTLVIRSGLKAGVRDPGALGYERDVRDPGALGYERF